VILEIISDTNQILHDSDIELLKHSCWPDAGQLQDLRRMNSSCGNNYFLTGKNSLPR
jgi:hypothetical protein